MNRFSLATSALALAIAGGFPSSSLIASTTHGPMNALSAAVAQSVVAPSAIDFTLDLGGVRFDPLRSAPAFTRESSGQPDLHLVQLDGPIQDGWLSGLRSAGVVPMQYIHPYSYVVWADAQTLAQAAARSEVRWTGHFAPEFRVIPSQRSFDATLRPTMALISRHADEGALTTALSAADATVHTISPVNRHFSVVHLDVPGAHYLQVAAIPGVYAVQEIGQDTGPRGEMSNQAVVGNYGPAPSNTIFPGYESWLIGSGYDGTGVIVGIVDGGINVGHQDLAGRISPCTSAGGTPTSCTSNNNSHGTHVAGAVAGTGASGVMLNGFLRGQGVAPGATVVEQRYSGFLGAGPGGMIPNGMLTIYKESALSNAVLTNNSWGPTVTPQGYDIPTQQIDIITRDANPDAPGAQPVLPVWSIMNGNGDSGGACAPSSVASPDEAKNLFAIGSTNLYFPTSTNQNPAIFDVSANSAHGNACDGRRIPHIVAPGCRTDSTSSGGSTSFGLSCGTSMASPVVSGAVAIYIEKYRDENNGETPSPALVKATFTAAAQNLEGFRNADNGIMGHRPDRFQGYGRLDLDKVINPGVPVYSIDQTEVFTSSGQSWSQELSAANPAEPMLIMLAWTDAPGHGLGGTTPAWVNNLDLSVAANSGTYLGNVIGADGWSATGGSADAMNNLEGVFLSPAQHGGSVTLTVDAINIAADALDPFNPNDPAQDFALVCYNCIDGEGPPVFLADLAVTAFDLPDPVEIGDELVFITQVANFGPDAANGVEVELSLPPELSYGQARSVQRSRGYDVRGSIEWTCADDAGTVTCTLPGSLPDASLAPVLEVVTSVAMSALPGMVETTIQVSSNTVDPNTGNNSVAVETEITGKPDAIFADGFECIVGVSDCPDPNIIVGTLDAAIPDDFGGLSVNWLTGDTQPGETPGYHFNPYRSDNPDSPVLSFWWGLGDDNAAGVSDGTNYLVLQSGDTVGPASNFITTPQGVPTINWRQPGGVDGYLGFRFTNTSTGMTNFGYVRMTTTGTDGFPATLLEYAYNQAGDPITIP